MITSELLIFSFVQSKGNGRFPQLLTSL